MRRTVNLDKIDDRKTFSDELLKEGLIIIIKEMRRRSDSNMDDNNPSYADMYKNNYGIFTEMLALSHLVKNKPWE